MNNSKRQQQQQSVDYQRIWENLYPGTETTKPPYPYTEIIKLCILKSPHTRKTLSQMYCDVATKFPFFANPQNRTGWKNTLRHNLSTQPYFVKLYRELGQPGKGHYWTYLPELENARQVSIFGNHPNQPFSHLHSHSHSLVAPLDSPRRPSLSSSSTCSSSLSSTPPPSSPSSSSTFTLFSLPSVSEVTKESAEFPPPSPLLPNPSWLPIHNSKSLGDHFLTHPISRRFT